MISIDVTAQVHRFDAEAGGDRNLAEHMYQARVKEVTLGKMSTWLMRTENAMKVIYLLSPYAIPLTSVDNWTSKIAIPENRLTPNVLEVVRGFGAKRYE